MMLWPQLALGLETFCSKFRMESGSKYFIAANAEYVESVDVKITVCHLDKIHADACHKAYTCSLLLRSCTR